MKRIIKVLIVLMCLLPIRLFASEKVKVYIFEAGGCPACEEEKIYLKSLSGYNKEFEVIVKELYVDHISWKNGKDYELGEKVVNAFNAAGFNEAKINVTPLIIISDVYAANGYSDSLESIINNVYESNDKDVVGCYEKGNTDCGLEENKSLNDDTSLRSLVVSIGDLNPVFDKNVFDYKVDVRGNVNEVNINATCNGLNCKVSGTGIVNLKDGNNEVEIKVTAENGNEQYYRINIFREENYYTHLYIGVAGALSIIIVTLIAIIWSILKNRRKK